MRIGITGVRWEMWGFDVWKQWKFKDFGRIFVFITIFLAKDYLMLRGYVAMGSGNCRFRRKEAQLCSAARKVQNEKTGSWGGGSLWNKLTGTLNKCIGVSFFRRTISPTVSSQERYSWFLEIVGLKITDICSRKILCNTHYFTMLSWYCWSSLKSAVPVTG